MKIYTCTNFLLDYTIIHYSSIWHFLVGTFRFGNKVNKYNLQKKVFKIDLLEDGMPFY
jgi:hypothetical protein